MAHHSWKETTTQRYFDLTRFYQCIERSDCLPHKLRSFLSRVNLKDCKEFEQNQSPMVAAVRAENNRKKLLWLMIKEFGLNINSTVKDGDDGWCALAAAIVKQDEEMVRFLVIDMGANVNIMKNGQTNESNHYVGVVQNWGPVLYVPVPVPVDTYTYLASKKIAPNSECLLLHWTMDHEMM